MKRVDRRIPTVAAVTVAILLSGCQTTDDKEGRLAAMGFNAAFSAALGSVTGGTLKSVVGSAFAGAMASAFVSDYRTKRMNPTAEERQLYEPTTPITQPQVKIQKVGNSPKWARPGQRISVWTRYWLNLPSDELTASTTESWTIKSEGTALVTLGPTEGEREGGKRESTLDFIVPGRVDPGTYVIEHRVQTGSNVDTKSSEFIVVQS